MSRKKIYIAEDLPLQADLIRSALEPYEAYAPSLFRDGLEIYRRVLQERPDLLVLDIILPSLSGLAITRLLKFHDDYRNIPVLLISSITDPQIKEKCRNAGGDVFLPKPFDVSQLLELIEQFLPPTNGPESAEQSGAEDAYPAVSG